MKKLVDRKEVYQAIDNERAYQAIRWNEVAAMEQNGVVDR